jgi:hypothetical protein
MPILGQEPIAGTRYEGAGTWVGGRYVPPASSPLAILGSVQPITGDELAQLPEGDRSRVVLKVYTSTELRTAQQENSGDADQLVVDGQTYEVQRVQQERSVIPHFKAWLARKQEPAEP